MAMTFRILWRVQPVKSGATAIIPVALKHTKASRINISGTWGWM